MGKPPAAKKSLVLLNPVSLEVSLPAWVPRRQSLGGRAVESCPPPNSRDIREVHKPHPGVQPVLSGSCNIYLKGVGDSLPILINWEAFHKNLLEANPTAFQHSLMRGRLGTGTPISPREPVTDRC